MKTQGRKAAETQSGQLNFAPSRLGASPLNVSALSQAPNGEEGESPEGWRNVRVGDLGRVVTGKTPPTSKPEFWDGNIPFITPADLTDGVIRQAGRTISEDGLAVVKELPRGSVAVSCIGYIGKVALIDCERSATNQQINAVVPSTDYDAQFLAYRFQTLKGQLEEAASMTTVPILNKSNFENVHLSAPPIPEQRAIAAVLRTAQGAKEACEEVLAATRQLKQSLLHHLFTYGPVPLADAAHVPLKETEYGSVPEAWDVVELKDAVAEIDYGLSAPIPKTPPKGGANIVSTADITKDGRLLYSQIRQVEAPARTIARLTLKGGDLLFNWRNSPELVGKTTIFDKQLEPHIFASFILRIRTDEHRTHNLFLKQLLNHYRTSGVFLSLARRAVNQANYNRNEISVLRIPLPPLPEQREIAAQLSAVDAKLAAEESRRAALAALFQSLLHSLMTGQVRLPEFAKAWP